VSLHELLCDFECEAAVLNGPSGFTVSGPLSALATAESFLSSRQVPFHRLPVPYAFHSRWIDEAEAPLSACLRRLSYGRPRIPVACCSIARHAVVFGAGHFWQVARGPVRFAATVEFLEGHGPHTYLDMGPSGSLATVLKYILGPTSVSTHAQSVWQRQQSNSLSPVGRCRASGSERVDFGGPPRCSSCLPTCMLQSVAFRGPPKGACLRGNFRRAGEQLATRSRDVEVWMSSIVALDPSRCRMWAMHDRSGAQITEASCRGEIDSFRRLGQLVPVLGRPLRDDPTHDVELIYGARRLFVARYTSKPLLAELREVTDREAIVAMDIENRQRTDISPYERGLSYARWLRSGYFQSQDDIARALKISCSQVSRLLKLARLPAAVVNAFESPLDIRESWGLSLIEALDDAARRELTLRKARAISAGNAGFSSREVYRRLLRASVPGTKPRCAMRDEVVKDRDGMALFRIRQQRSSIALVIPTGRLSSATLEKIRESVVRFLNQPRVQVDVTYTLSGAPAERLEL
jgi:ParB family chromosome partitioning protein